MLALWQHVVFVREDEINWISEFGVEAWGLRGDGRGGLRVLLGPQLLINWIVWVKSVATAGRCSDSQSYSAHVYVEFRSYGVVWCRTVWMARAQLPESSAKTGENKNLNIVLRKKNQENPGQFVFTSVGWRARFLITPTSSLTLTPATSSVISCCHNNWGTR